MSNYIPHEKQKISKEAIEADRKRMSEFVKFLFSDKGKQFFDKVKQQIKQGK